MEFGILGPLEVRRDGQALSLRGARLRALLAILLTNTNRVVGGERLVELLWGEEPPESAEHALQVYVSQLRKILEPDGPPYRVLLSRPPGYMLQIGPDELDAARFETLLEKARDSPPDQAAAQLRQALSLWRGPALADFSSHAFALGETTRLTELRLRATEDRIEADLRLGRHAELVGELQGLVAEHPLRERLRGQLMLALYRSGRQAEASSVYQRTRELLVEELGMEPGPMLQQLLKQILTQDPVLNASTRPLPAEPMRTGGAPVAPPSPPGKRDLRSLPGRAALTPLSTGQQPNARPQAQATDSGEPAGSGQPFFGRTSALATLTVAFEQAQVGSGGLALVAGEAGIGKTRLVTELARTASRLGANVIWANCWDEEGTPPFWPWIELVRHYAARREPAVLCEELGQGGAEIVRLVPQVAQLCPDLATSALTETEGTRFNLFDSLVAFLRQASSSQALLLVIDDLHWADQPSLRLLKFAAVELRDSRVLIVGTYRDTEVAAKGALARLLGELTGPVQHIMLAGLGALEVSELLGHLVGAAVSAEEAAAIHARTNGNPFFVREIVRLQATQAGHDEVVPVAVQEVVGRRLEGLSPGCRSLLEAASVIGQDFEPALVGEVAGVTVFESVQQLREAASARLVGVTLDVSRFVHALVRETVYMSIDTDRRRRLHRRVAAAVERRHADDLGGHVEELALHCREAGARADLRRALDYAIQAGERSMSLFAYEHAASHFERALQMLALVAPGQRGRAGSLHLALGRARIASGELAAGRHSLQQAARIGRELNDSELLAQTALSLGAEFAAGIVDDLEVQLLSEALALLGPEESTLRARLQARLARALLFTQQVDRRTRLAEEATSMARRLGDPSSLAAVLYERHQAIWFAPPELRLAMTEEMVDLAERCGDRTLSQRGRVLRLADLMEIGDQERLRTELDEYARRLDERRQLPHLWHVPLLNATLAALNGNFVEAERLADESLNLGRRYQQPGIDAFHEGMWVSLRHLQGRLNESVDRLEQGVRAYPAIPSFRCAHLLALSEAGRHDEARTILERLAARGSVDLPQDHLLVYGLALLATACLQLDEKELAGVLYEMLLPYGPYNVRQGRIGNACIGSAQHYLGLLAMTMCRWNDAVNHLEAALAANTRQGFLAAAVHSRYQLGRALVRRAEEGDHHRGRTLTAEAQVAAARHGIRLAPDGVQWRKMPGADHPLSARELQIAELVAQGLTNPEIAQRLFISTRTAETHVDHIKDKLGISTRAQLVAWILERQRTR